MDAVTNMYRCDIEPLNMHDEEYHVNLEDITENDVSEESASQCKRSGGTSTKGTKKRKHMDESRGVYEFLGEISRTTNQRLVELNQRVGYEFDIGEARKIVFDQVSLIPGLSLDEIFDITELIAYKVERLEIFIGLSPEARIAYALRILQGKSK
ncbi:uncharacterized protein LOC131016339 isoform X1 [Salvia miltiorrhiza]|uniref:uncharacterized protein LOC131016339 isoform X1 n=1 Tax=Salvia miltiorrhiza TaxID=226208 RepID=UPI0025AB8861|nr:uncharacterized protein LOC131016339 isoform X1 [Salvia miltiorrhiza]